MSHVFVLMLVRETRLMFRRPAELVNPLVFFVIFIAYIAIPLFIILLFLGYKISIRKPQGAGVDISSMMNDIKNKFTEQNQKTHKDDMASPTTQDQDNDNDYNELTIE